MTRAREGASNKIMPLVTTDLQMPLSAEARRSALIPRICATGHPGSTS